MFSFQRNEDAGSLVILERIEVAVKRSEDAGRGPSGKRHGGHGEHGGTPLPQVHQGGGADSNL